MQGPQGLACGAGTLEEWRKDQGKNGPVGIANTSGWSRSGKKHRASRTATLGHTVARVNFNPTTTFQQDDSTCPAPHPSYDPSVHQLLIQLRSPGYNPDTLPKICHDSTPPRVTRRGEGMNAHIATHIWFVPWTTGRRVDGNRKGC